MSWWQVSVHNRWTVLAFKAVKSHIQLGKRALPQLQSLFPSSTWSLLLVSLSKHHHTTPMCGRMHTLDCDRKISPHGCTCCYQTHFSFTTAKPFQLPLLPSVVNAKDSSGPGSLCNKQATQPHATFFMLLVNCKPSCRSHRLPQSWWASRWSLILQRGKSEASTLRVKYVKKRTSKENGLTLQFACEPEIAHKQSSSTSQRL